MPSADGRWRWPLAVMEPGEYFHVDHLDRDPEKLRHMVSVRGAQLKRRFVTIKDDPEKFGFARVECVGEGEAPKATLGYASAKAKLEQWYGIDIEKLPMDKIEGWEEVSIGARKRVQPPVKRVVFEVYPLTIGALLMESAVRFARLHRGATVEEWEKHEEEWDMARVHVVAELEWKRKHPEKVEKSRVMGFWRNDPSIDEVMS